MSAKNIKIIKKGTSFFSKSGSLFVVLTAEGIEKILHYQPIKVMANGKKYKLEEKKDTESDIKDQRHYEKESFR